MAKKKSPRAGATTPIAYPPIPAHWTKEMLSAARHLLPSLREPPRAPAPPTPARQGPSRSGPPVALTLAQTYEQKTPPDEPEGEGDTAPDGEEPPAEGPESGS